MSDAPRPERLVALRKRASDEPMELSRLFFQMTNHSREMELQRLVRLERSALKAIAARRKQLENAPLHFYGVWSRESRIADDAVTPHLILQPDDGMDQAEKAVDQTMQDLAHKILRVPLVYKADSTEATAVNLIETALLDIMDLPPSTEPPEYNEDDGDESSSE